MSAPPLAVSPGALLADDGVCHFRVWAPHRERVQLLLHDPDRVLPMRRGGDGVFHAELRGVPEHQRYTFRLDGDLERPDPASRLQPDGVHGRSAVVRRRQASAPRFAAPPLSDLVLYEVHVGTFTAEGTFLSAIERLDYLVGLGVNALELMPVAQFPGARNWGYDGVYAFAVQSSYGGPEGLAELVRACHERGLAVILDVVYNHVGPEGNYFADFGPYFSDSYATPWGQSLNFDGPGSEGVRWHFLCSARYFVEELGIDGLRVDAVHAFLDRSARPFLQQLTEAMHSLGDQLGRRVHVIAESDLNDARILLPPEMGGLGMDAQWSDDFHHALHALLTGERGGYYADFGTLEHLATAYREGWVFRGDWSSHRQRNHGNSPRLLEPRRFVVYSQTHDQVGNRARGDRHAESLSAAQQRAAAAALLLSPFVPLLFMGQEYGETAPFCYFTSFADAELQEAVRAGRQRDFAAFGWRPQDLVDPSDPAAFERSRLTWDLVEQQPHRQLLDLHRELLALRRDVAALRDPGKDRTAVEAWERKSVLVIRRWSDGWGAVLVLHFGQHDVDLHLRLPPGVWRCLLDTEDVRWGGRGRSVAPVTQSDGVAPLRLAATSAVLLANEARE